MFLINFQLWVRNGKIPGGGNFNIRGDLILVGSDYNEILRRGGGPGSKAASKWKARANDNGSHARGFVIRACRL